MENNLKISINCDHELKSAFEGFASEFIEDVQDKRYVQPQNLDGTTAAWVVIATLTAQIIPHLLSFMSEHLSRNRVTRFKVGEIEIDNPTQEDLRKLRKLLDAKLDLEERNGDSPTAR